MENFEFLPRNKTVVQEIETGLKNYLNASLSTEYKKDKENSIINLINSKFNSRCTKQIKEISKEMELGIKIEEANSFKDWEACGAPFVNIINSIKLIDLTISAVIEKQFDSCLKDCQTEHSERVTVKQCFSDCQSFSEMTHKSHVEQYSAYIDIMKEELIKNI